MKSKIKNIAIGIVIGFVIAIAALPATAEIILPKKTVDIYPGVKVYVNDKLVEPKDINGNTVECFIYNSH